MADISSTPEDSSSRPANLSMLTGLLEGTYACPECGAVVVRIEGNSIQYLHNHVRESAQPDVQGYVSLVFCHPAMREGGMIFPPHGARLPPDAGHPFLTVQSSTMVPHPHK